MFWMTKQFIPFWARTEMGTIANTKADFIAETRSDPIVERAYAYSPLMYSSMAI
jgi:hypothetical protein